MLNEEAIYGPYGMAIVWVIDGQCLYDLPVLPDYVSMFTESDEVLDVSANYPDHDGITVRFVKGTEPGVDFQTSEYFGSILLSDPQVIDLAKYPYGDYVISPDALFDGEKFVITNRDLTEYPQWRYLDNPNIPQEYLDNL
jgi:hypothetical protein